MSGVEGKVCIVTGSNSGIGKEIALGLAQKQAQVVMVVRNLEKGKTARSEIITQTGNHSVDLMVCDLSSMEQIRRFAEEFKAKYDQLHVLINNAGAVFFKRLTTVDGFERTLAVDYLAPFLLTHEFLPLLKSSAPSRIINISSGLHTSGRVNLDDLQSTENYKGMQVYRNAKLMLIMFTYELARRLERTGVTANVALPGFAATNLGKDGGSRMQWWSFKMVRFMQINAKEAAETPLYLASSKEVEGITSKCFRKLKEMPTAPVSYDQQMQKSLWDATSKMLSTSFPQL